MQNTTIEHVQDSIIRFFQHIFLPAILIFLSLFVHAAHSSPDLSQKGQSLRAFFDQCDVENRWLKGFRVDWQTGMATAPAKKSSTTHCSAFAASVLSQKGIEIPRPPQYALKNLANAQFEYLGTSQARDDGWLELDEPHLAQERANDGYFVVAVVQGRNGHPGHIAFIYPQPETRPIRDMKELQIVQAGHVNGVLPLEVGFERHKQDLEDHTVRFYCNTKKFNQ